MSINAILIIIIRAIMVSLIMSFIINRLVLWKELISKKTFLQCSFIITCVILLIHRIPLAFKIPLSYILIVGIILNIYKKNIFTASALGFFTSIITILSDICGGLLLFFILKITSEQMVGSIYHILLYHIVMLLIAYILSEVVNRTCRDLYINKKLLKSHQIVLPIIFILVLFIISIIGLIIEMMQSNTVYDAQLYLVIIIFMITSMIVSYFVFIKEHLVQKNEFESIKMKIEIDAMTNTLTRDYGIKYMKEQIENCKDKKLPISFGFIDINNLKQINDNYGHIEGDKSIIKVSDIINDTLRKSDLVCRVGGDEFIFALPGCCFEKAEEVVSRIKYSLENASKKLPYEISISVGLYEKNPMDEIVLEDIIVKIDREMYRDKNRFKYFIEKSF